MPLLPVLEQDEATTRLVTALAALEVGEDPPEMGASFFRAHPTVAAVLFGFSLKPQKRGAA